MKRCQYITLQILRNRKSLFSKDFVFGRLISPTLILHDFETFHSSQYFSLSSDPFASIKMQISYLVGLVEGFFFFFSPLWSNGLNQSPH